MIRSILVLILCFFSTTVFAHIEGEFVSTGEYTITQEKQIAVIKVHGRASQDKLSKYKNQGYSCIRKASLTYKCFKFVNSKQLPEDANIQKLDMNVNFLTAKHISNFKSPISEVKTIIAEQDVYISGVKYSGVRYIYNKDIIKIKVGIDSVNLNPVYFLVKNGHFTKVEPHFHSYSQQIWTEYLLSWGFLQVDQ